MSAWLLISLLGCPKPAPAPAAEVPAAEPPALQSRLDGWSIVHTDHRGQSWTELWGPEAAELAAEAVADGVAAQRGPNDMPDDLIPETARSFFGAYGVPPRPIAWSWPDHRTDEEVVQVYHPTTAPMAPYGLEVVGVGPAKSGSDDALGLRVWFRALGDAPPPVSVTDWSARSEPPEGATMRSFQAMPPSCAALGIEPVTWSDPARAPNGTSPACSVLPIGEDHLVATEHLWQDDQDRIAGSCAAVALRRKEGGVAWFTPACFDGNPEDTHGMEHLDERTYSDVSGAHLPRAVFGRGDARWLVVNQSHLPVAQRCLARIPQPDRPLQPVACVGDRSDLGGF